MSEIREVYNTNGESPFVRLSQVAAEVGAASPHRVAQLQAELEQAKKWGAAWKKAAKGNRAAARFYSDDRDHVAERYVEDVGKIAEVTSAKIETLEKWAKAWGIIARYYRRAVIAHVGLDVIRQWERDGCPKYEPELPDNHVILYQTRCIRCKKLVAFIDAKQILTGEWMCKEHKEIGR